MITIYRKKADTALEIYTEPTEGCWINVVDPTPEEITSYKPGHSPRLPHLLPGYDERPAPNEKTGSIYPLARAIFPRQNGRHPYTTIPLGIILSHELIITVCRFENDVIQELPTVAQKTVHWKTKPLRPAAAPGTANRYLSHLREITKTVELLEDELQLSTRNKEVLELLKYQKSLTYFTTSAQVE